jgi:hypothetical protein
MGDERRLESWKEIGVYLQKDLRTARRWEKEEGLPVHRHSHKSRASVYAFPSEIDAWRASRKVVPEPVPPRLLWKIPAFAVTLLLCLVMVGNGVRPAGAQQNQALAKRLLCAECGDLESDLSLDGRSMAVTEWWSGDLGIQDTSTGQIKRLMVKAGDWKDSEAFAESPVFSRDLSQMAYLWDTGEKPFHVQLRIASNDSGKSRVVLDNPENNYYQPLDWSPDGKRLLVSIQKLDKTWQLEWVSAVDGAVVLLKSVGWRFYNTGNRPRLSPNGQFIAYSALAENPGTSCSAMARLFY